MAALRPFAGNPRCRRARPGAAAAAVATTGVAAMVVALSLPRLAGLHSPKGTGATIAKAFVTAKHLQEGPLGSLRRIRRSHGTAGAATATSTSTVTNPLLDSSGLPKYQSITSDHVAPAVDNILTDLRSTFGELEEQLPSQPATYAGIVEALEKLRYPLEYGWGVVSHLNGVKNSDSLRTVYQEMQPQVVKASMELEQSRAVYDALAKLETGDLTGPQQRVVNAALRSMRLSGVNLEGEAKEEFTKIALKLSELGTNFQNQMLDATKAFELIIRDPEELAGLPASAMAAAAQSYAQKYKDEPEPTAEAGPWRLTLDMPSYLPAMQHVKSAKLRETLYRAFISRASEGDLDNSPLIAEILKLRQRAAALLGYKNFAEKSLASKMADDVAAVDGLISQLFNVARPAAEKELAELREFAASRGHEGDVQLWDVPYWSERLKEDRYAYDEEALRPYFSLPKVLDGMFGIASKLFGITIQRDDEAAERWHADVMFFNVMDAESGEHIASFYLDPYSRPAEKRGGAWMDSAVGRSKVLDKKPVAYLTCNGSPPVGDRPSLMRFSEAETLFHEFGHGLQHMLTHVDEGDVAGINNVEWDAVELPSQFMENWLYHKATVDSFAVHYETGELLPADVFEKIQGSRTFMAASVLMRQLQFAALDMELHARLDAEAGKETALDVQRRIASKYALLKPLDEDRFLNSFMHIFASGYAAGYYSYKWAEVLSADAFAAFEEAGLEDDAALAATGRRFRETVLGRGGSQHPSEVYREFRGKDATVDALLRHNGLL